MKPTTYFLIGGKGFIGSAFARYLHTRQANIHIIGRGQISGSHLLQDSDDVIKNLKLDDSRNIVVDFAYTSVPNTSYADPVKDFSENLYNVNAHLAFTARLPQASYIHISSGGTVYGNTGKQQPIVESAPNTPLSPYGITKLACEKYTLMYQQVYGLDVKIIRPANIYGPGQKPFRGQGFIATAIAKILKSEPIQLFGDGSTIRDYLYIDDFCEALHSVIHSGHNGEVYNVGSEEGHTTKEVLEAIITAVGQDNKAIDYLPVRPFDVQYNVLDCTKLKQVDAAYKRTTLQQGIAASIDWVSTYLETSEKVVF